MIRRPLASVMVVSILATGAPAAAQAAHLSLAEAEQQALANHPAIRAAQDIAQAAAEGVRLVRSAYGPTVTGALTGAAAEDGTRITAGAFNNPTILDRVAYGVAGTQLVTDFGRTSALSNSARLRADAEQQDAATRRATVLLSVDQAYFEVLRAQAIRRVADRTVQARQLVVDQVTALADSGLKAGLDVSFVQVSLSEAQLLQLQARNDEQSAYAGLADALGVSAGPAYDLAEEPLPSAPGDLAPLVAAALRDRPDIQRARLSQEAQARLADAEGDLWRPTVAVAAAAGMTPYHQSGLNDHYAAAGVNVAVPIFNGHLFAARHAQATFLADAESQATQDLTNQIARDVQVAWLGLQTALRRLDVARQLQQQATDAVDLAQQRYNLGLSSIVELTQAQLNQTNAQITQATAQYDCQERAAVLRYQTGVSR